MRVDDDDDANDEHDCDDRWKSRVRILSEIQLVNFSFYKANS
jgi:hypothetical protein